MELGSAQGIELEEFRVVEKMRTKIYLCCHTWMYLSIKQMMLWVGVVYNTGRYNFRRNEISGHSQNTSY